MYQLVHMARMPCCRRQQEELARRMKEMDKEDMEFEEHVGSLKEQAQQYTKKLKKLYASYQTKKSEREGLRKEFQVWLLDLKSFLKSSCCHASYLKRFTLPS